MTHDRSVKRRRRRTSRCPILQNQCTRGRQDGDSDEHDVHVPFPLDHFFFCFFAPVAAGAILTDLLGLRWDVDGWSVECLNGLEEVGVVEKRFALPNPYQCTTHSSGQPKTFEFTTGRRTTRGTASDFWGTTAPHQPRSPNRPKRGLWETA